MFPFTDITDEQLKEMGWEGAIESLQDLLDIQGGGLDVVMDQLSTQMAEMINSHGVPVDVMMTMAETQSQIFQSFLTIGRIEQQITMMKELHKFIQRTKAQYVDEMLKEEA